MTVVYPVGDDPSTTRLPSSAQEAPTAPGPRRFGQLTRFGAAAGAAVLLAAGAVVGSVAGADYIMRGGNPTPTSGAASENRRVWAQQYGQNTAALPELPDITAGTPAQVAAATILLTQTIAGTSRYANTVAAQGAGYGFADALARAKANPSISERLSRIDSKTRVLKPVVLRVLNTSYLHDGKVLDPTAPEGLIYTYQGHATWQLIGAIFRADESYPGPPPDPGGPITRWHYDNAHPATLTMDVYFVVTNDIAHAYATTPPAR